MRSHPKITEGHLDKAGMSGIMQASFMVRALPLLLLLGLTVCFNRLGAEVVTATVRSVEGTAEYAEQGSKAFKPLKVGMRIEIGSTIKTSAQSTVILRVMPGAAMRISPETTVVLNEMLYSEENGVVKARKANIDLKEGTVSSLLKKGEPLQTDFKIQTPQGSAAARGTFYGVTVQDGQTYISVKEGKVGFNLIEEEPM